MAAKNTYSIITIASGCAVDRKLYELTRQEADAINQVIRDFKLDMHIMKLGNKKYE